MSIDYQEAWDAARDEAPFSTGTEGHDWTSQWCDRCQRDAPFRNGINSQGCNLLLVALNQRTPAQWFEQPPVPVRGRPDLGLIPPYGAERFHCIEFRAPGSGGEGPRPKPEPPDMDGLFPKPERTRRQFVPVPAQAAARRVEELEPAECFL